MGDIVTLFNEVSLICGRLAVEMNLIPLAVDLVGKVLGKNPGDKAALLLLAKIHLLKREYQEVVGLLEDREKDLKLWVILSLACYRLGLYDRAVRAMDQCKGGDENDLKLDLNLSILRCRILLLTDLHDVPLQATVPQFEKTLELTQLYNVPTLHLEALLTRAQLFEKCGDWEKCFFDLEDSISILQNHDAMTHFQIKDFLYKTTFAFLYKIFLQEKLQNELEPTDQLFRECYKFPHTLETIHMLNVAQRVHGVIMGERPDVKAFVSELSCCSVVFKPFVYFIAGRFMVEFGDHESLQQALEYYQSSLELDPSRIYVWLSLALLRLKLGQIPDALFAFSKTIEMLDSRNEQQYSISRHSYLERENDFRVLSWFGTAQAHLSANAIDQSLEAMEKALSLSTNCNLLVKSKLQDFVETLRSRDQTALHSLKESTTLPEIPLPFFLNPVFYLQEIQVFQVESRLGRCSLIPPTFSSPNRRSSLNSGYRSSSNQDDNKKSRKKPMRKVSDGVKPTRFRNKKKNDIFRRANLSISKGDKNYLNQHKKKHPHSNEESRKSTFTHTSNHNHNQEHNHNFESNVNGVAIANVINNNATVDDHNHTGTAPIIPHPANLTPDQHQQFGYLYQSDDQTHHNQLHPHHESAPYSYPAFISSHNPGIYPASYSNQIQPIGFSASPSFYYPQQSIDEAFRNNSNGLGEQSLQPNFGPPVIMPQFSNPVYISDGTRFAANSLQPTIIPLMSTQQPPQPQYPPLQGKHADVITYTDR